MITVDHQMWTTLAGLASLALVLLGYLGTMKRDLITTIGKVEYRLDTKIDGVRTELKTDIAALDTKVDGVRTELRNEIAASHIDLKTDIGKVEDRLTAIESRTYDISTRLPPAPASTPR